MPCPHQRGTGFRSHRKACVRTALLGPCSKTGRQAPDSSTAHRETRGGTRPSAMCRNAPAHGDPRQGSPDARSTVSGGRGCTQGTVTRTADGYPVRDCRDESRVRPTSGVLGRLSVATQRCHVLFNSLCRVLLHLSLTVLVRYRSRGHGCCLRGRTPACLRSGFRLRDSPVWPTEGGPPCRTDGTVTLLDGPFQATLARRPEGWRPGGPTATPQCLRPHRAGFGDGLFRVRSPLLTESPLLDVPPPSDMLKFSGLPCRRDAKPGAAVEHSLALAQSGRRVQGLCAYGPAGIATGWVPAPLRHGPPSCCVMGCVTHTAPSSCHQSTYASHARPEGGVERPGLRLGTDSRQLPST